MTVGEFLATKLCFVQLDHCFKRKSITKHKKVVLVKKNLRFVPNNRDIFL